MHFFEKNHTFEYFKPNKSGPIPNLETLNSLSHIGGVPYQLGCTLDQKQKTFMIAQNRVDRVFLAWATYSLRAFSLLELYLTKSVQPCFPIVFSCVFSPGNCKKRNKKTKGQS